MQKNLTAPNGRKKQGINHFIINRHGIYILVTGNLSYLNPQLFIISMKKSIALYVVMLNLVLAFSLFNQTEKVQAQSTDGLTGVGIILGEPTGLAGHYFLTENTALAAGLAWSFSGSNRLHIHIDYQINNFDLISVEHGKLSFYYGIGGRIQIRENRDDKLGVRIPLGLNYFFAEGPFSVFIEAVPVLDLVPGTDFGANGGLGFRYHF